MASIRKMCSSYVACGLFVIGAMLIANSVAVAWEIEQIRFVAGASSAEVHGGVVRGDQALYSIEARQGQRMSVRISSTEKNAVFQLYAPGAKPETVDSILQVEGESLPGAGEGDDAMQWSGILPRSGSYLVVVGGTRGNANYRLKVEIR